MSRALFIQNEKVETIRRIPPISSNQFSFPACSQLNTNHHFLPDYYLYTFYGVVNGLHYTLLYLFAGRPTPRLHATPMP